MTDNLDNCPNTVANATIDANGCEVSGGGSYSAVIEAENFDSASEYIVTGTMNGPVVGANYLNNGTWLTYDPVTIPSSGVYNVSFRVSGYSDNAIRLQDGAGNDLGTVSFTNSQDWASWITVTTSMTLTAGSLPLKMIIDGFGPLSVDSITIEAQ
ncbi:MAG: hypothetical protein COA42_12380 [Alteromonadaceae bacterium]|nr:MAG: hypothetical protein COA42_12380 [Alteromonadaceae bacterium]